MSNRAVPFLLGFGTVMLLTACFVGGTTGIDWCTQTTAHYSFPCDTWECAPVLDSVTYLPEGCTPRVTVAG